MTTITATAPAKVILIGEHAVNRGAAALAVSLGLYATVELRAVHSLSGESARLSALRLEGGGHAEVTTREAVLALGEQVDAWRAQEDYAAIQALAQRDFFAPARYVLAALGAALPARLDVRFASAIPTSAGLGSGGACFAALAAALFEFIHQEHEGGPKRHNQAAAAPDLRALHALRGSERLRQIASWAQRGDILAHGGVASGLDTQTALYGGAIRYTAGRQGEPVAFGADIALVVGNTGVFASTSEVNGRVRRWLAERPARMHAFGAIGLLARHAETALRDGDWPELGRLMNLNQLVLARIGVSCPELEALIDAALDAGALGAKLSGSGGGGIMAALVTAETTEPVARAIVAAGGEAIVAPVGVPGVTLKDEG
jgi:mevalonate kinase